MTHSASPRPDGKVLILAVERDPHVRELERYILEQAGCTVEFVEDGAQALDRARTLMPDLLISEILVPRLDGLNLCRAIKNDPATQHTHVLIFSLLAAEDRGRAAGADAYLRKPLNREGLIQSVEQLLAQRARGGSNHGTSAYRQ